MERTERFKIFAGWNKRNIRSDKFRNIQAIFNFLDGRSHSSYFNRNNRIRQIPYMV